MRCCSTQVTTEGCTPAFTTDWAGISADAARGFGHKKITAFAVDSPGPGIPGVSNEDVHRFCGQMVFTHYENLVNFDKVLGVGRFRFIAFPLKIRRGAGSPVGAVAVYMNRRYLSFRGPRIQCRP